MITPETATVYRATIGKHTKRFFSKPAAATWLAKQLIKRHCYCEEGIREEFYAGFTCHYHDSRNKQITTRLTRFILHMEATP